MSFFKDFLLEHKNERSVRIFFDIETLQYNEYAGREKPSLYKNVTYSVAIGFYLNYELKIKIYPSFELFFNDILRIYDNIKQTPRIELIAHNNNKYDNHYLRHDLIYFYNLPVRNLYLKNATNEGNMLSIKKGSLKKKDKEGIILEKRIKSSNNLELTFFINGIEFFTTDNFVKTNTSIKVLGQKMLRLGILTDDDLKTDFNYTEFNRDYDMTTKESYKYALKVFNELTDDHLTYIRNDIIILANSVTNYSKIFQGFDWNKITFTSNILQYYNDNDLTSYQLLKSVGQGSNKKHLKYTNYKFSNENFYDYLKSFYNGGLNFYNDQYVGKIIYDPLIGLDINSSYPYVMHNYKVPTFLKGYKEFDTDTPINIVYNDDFYLYRMSKQYFDYEIIEQIESRVIRQMLVKYYSSSTNFVNINTYTLKLIKELTGIKINKLTVHSYVFFECLYFNSRDKIAEKYEIKEKGSSNNKLDYTDPYNIVRTNDRNDEMYSQGEIDISKVILNGLYGIPALRSHFNIFRWVSDDLQNVANGYENNERNIVFSVFVTSVSLYNLLQPLSYLTQKEIDENFIYCDTDSLYLKKSIFHKIPDTLFHDHHLGKWSIDDGHIEKFIVINHKKYAYYSYNKKKKRKYITVKCGGVPNDSFNFNVDFEIFVKEQFSDGVKITNQKSIYNEQGTISIYKSTTRLQVGKGYQLFSYDEIQDKFRKEMVEEILKSNDGSEPDLLYIESNLGSFSFSDLFPVTHEVDKKQKLFFLKRYEEYIRRNFLQNY